MPELRQSARARAQQRRSSGRSLAPAGRGIILRRRRRAYHQQLHLQNGTAAAATHPQVEAVGAAASIQRFVSPLLILWTNSYMNRDGPTYITDESLYPTTIYVRTSYSSYTVFR